MDKGLLEIQHYTGEGYRPLIDFKSWRVAVLRWLPDIMPENTDRMERHTQTDEVFVLIAGHACLILGGNSAMVDTVQSQIMEPGILYNVKMNVWHAVILSRDATVLIVEERNTGRENTEYCTLSREFREVITGISLE